MKVAKVETVDSNRFCGDLVCGVLVAGRECGRIDDGIWALLYFCHGDEASWDLSLPHGSDGTAGQEGVAMAGCEIPENKFIP